MSKAASISSPVAAAVSPRGAGLDANPTSVGSQMVRLSRPGGGVGVGGLHGPPPVSSMGSYLGRGGGGPDNSSGRGPQFPAASFGMEQAVMQQPSRPVSLQTRSVQTIICIHRLPGIFISYFVLISITPGVSVL